MQQHHCVKKIPSRSRRWCRRWAVLSWFCRRRGFPGGYTTAAYKDQMCGTVGRKRVQLITRNCATTETLGGDRVTVRNPNQPSRMRLQWALKQKTKKTKEKNHNDTQNLLFFFFFQQQHWPCTVHWAELRNTQPFMQTKPKDGQEWQDFQNETAVIL